MEDYYEYLDSNGVTTLYKLIKDDTVALIDSYSVTINGITTNLDNHVNNADIHTPIATIEGMIDTAVGSLNYATPDYVDTKVADLVNSSPETLDTLKELSDALGNDSNFATTVANQIGSKASKDDVYTKEEADTLLESKANSVHSHVVSDITDFPTIPTKVSDLTNDSGYITSVSWEDVTSKPELSQVAISGSYSDLSDTPIIPTKTSQLINDSGFLTGSSGLITSVSWSDITNKPNFSTVATSGSYTDLSNTPTIPTKVSQLENDMGFGTGGDTSDCVHKTGDETIAGTKTFTASPFVSNYAVTNGFFTKLNNVARNEVPSQIYHSAFRVFDKNSKTLGEYCVEKSTSGSSLLHMDVHTEDSEGNDIMESVYLNLSNDGSTASFHPAKNNRIDLGMSGYKWAKIYSDDIVHTSGDETIDGVKTFTQGINIQKSDIDLTITPTSNKYSTYLFTDKNNKSLGVVQYAQRSTDVNDLDLYVFDKNSTAHGIQITTNNALSPIGKNYSLGSSSAKWKNVYATTFNGNLQGNADTATKASYLDNYSLPGGNKIYLDWGVQVKGYVGLKVDKTTMGGLITTANIGTYVNSRAGFRAVGPNAVGSSISAYYSNATTLTAEGSSSSSGGSYPSDYSDYINIAPTVGTIYTGSQLFGTLNASASGSTNSYSPSGSTVYQTTAKATANFSGAFSASAKYLCTTANAVKFRAFVSEGTTSNIGTASIVDNSSTKSIFTRIE